MYTGGLEKVSVYPKFLPPTLRHVSHLLLLYMLCIGKTIASYVPRANYKALGNDRAPPDPCITTLAFGSRIHGGAMQGRADQLAPRVVVGRADEQDHRWRLLASESAS